MMVKASTILVLGAIWVDEVCASKVIDNPSQYQKQYGLKSSPQMEHATAFKNDGKVGLSVNLGGQQLDLNLEPSPVVEMDGSRKQYTYSCTNPEVPCSVTLFPKGGVNSLLVSSGNEIWVMEDVGNGELIVYKASDVEDSSLRGLVHSTNVRKDRSINAGRQVKSVKNTQEDVSHLSKSSNNHGDGSDYGYMGSSVNTRVRRATVRKVLIQLTYDTAYLTAVAEKLQLSASQATIAQADGYTMTLLNHLNNIYAPQVGIKFEMASQTLTPNEFSVDGNYGQREADGTTVYYTDLGFLSEVFQSDISTNTAGLNMLLSGLDMDNNASGLAYPAAACEQYASIVILTPLRLTSVFFQVALFAHEIGYSFGCVDSDDKNLIMSWPQNDARVFGTDCRAAMASYVLQVEADTSDKYVASCFESQEDTNPCFTAVGQLGVCGYGLCYASGSDYLCDCTGSGYSGDDCTTAIGVCGNSGISCQNGGTCVDSGDTSVCNCANGFDGSMCQYETCAGVSPCNGRGSCVDTVTFGDLITGYTCDCNSGFEGTRCETTSSTICTGNPCGTGGTCTDNGDSTYSCDCAVGYSLSTVTLACVDVDDCASDPCGTGGTCTDGINTHSCTCASGYSVAADGKSCIDIDNCANSPCGADNTCTDGVDTYSCTCAVGYSLASDQKSCVNIDDCATSDICGVGGTCVDAVNNYSCTCAAGYSVAADGKSCIDIDNCANNPCGAGNTCIDGIDTYSCTCAEGYQQATDGKSCVNINECLIPNFCGPGVCYDSEGSFTCDCSSTLKAGSNCQNDRDWCIGNNCENGECVARTNSVGYDCTCDYGWVGVLCNREFGICVNEPCQNGAACEPSGNAQGFYCYCPEGFAGPVCGVRIGTCEAGDACLNGGTCSTNADRTYECTCPPGYQGTRCGEEINECVTANTCVKENTKLCTDKFLGVECTCKPGYSGPNCETFTNNCGVGIPDEDYYGNAICRCPMGYSGDQCERPPLMNSRQINSCAVTENVCGGRGNCENEDLGGGETRPKCSCFGGFDSYNCATVTYNSCENNPCLVGGTCQSRLDGSFKCKCVAGRIGDLCEIEVDECDPDPCITGKCKDKLNGFECRCPTGFYGKTCASRTPV